jgi:CheY-like chemotaxis protein
VIADPKRNSRACIAEEIRGQNGGITIAMAAVTPPMFRILFVSPDGDLRAVASRVLARAGWEVTTAAHAGHASLACAMEIPFDILVVEDDMADTSGAAIAYRLRRYCPELRVLRLCDRDGARDAEGMAVVRPFTADDLIEAVAAAACAMPAF